MDVICSAEEMAECCYTATKKSKKKPLPQEKITLIEGIQKKININDLKLFPYAHRFDRQKVGERNC